MMKCENCPFYVLEGVQNDMKWCKLYNAEAPVEGCENERDALITVPKNHKQQNHIMQARPKNGLIYLFLLIDLGLHPMYQKHARIFDGFVLVFFSFQDVIPLIPGL
jgi:hypothetical protein